MQNIAESCLFRLGRRFDRQPDTAIAYKAFMNISISIIWKGCQMMKFQERLIYTFRITLFSKTMDHGKSEWSSMPYKNTRKGNP